MKHWLKSTAIVVVLVVLALQMGPTSLAANDKITTAPTRYQKADDVEYVIVGGTVVNWGARGEICSFLSTYAEAYYTDNYDWERLSVLDGGTGTSDAYSSQLYQSLQSMMKAKHTRLQGYQDTRPYYQYTDCVANDYSLISSFYSGNTVKSKWDGSTYNREHIWPKSKCLYNNKTNDSADIMMLRATISSENSNRGNSAYGESGGYYDPGASVRGDCARMVLYGYVRWGNTGKMWGTGGVIESLDVLLKWMEEDPVDTWEMGRNDAVESITGVRNVFVDFPELAWLLFGEEIPKDMPTPSGSKEQESCKHKSTQLQNQLEATCGSEGYTGDTVCANCGVIIAAGEVIPTTGKHNMGDWITAPGGGKESRWCSICGYEEERDLPDCIHKNTELSGKKEPTCTEDGYTGDVLCYDCGCFTEIGEVISATGHLHTDIRGRKNATCSENGYTGDTYCTECDSIVTNGKIVSATGHQHTELRGVKDATCSISGYSGDLYCTDCNTMLEQGSLIPITGEHDFSEWSSNEDGSGRSCKVCGYLQWEDSPKPAPNWPTIILVTVSVILICGIGSIMIVRRKRNSS